jgi:hypothetical protein
MAPARLRASRAGGCRTRLASPSARPARGPSNAAAGRGHATAAAPPSTAAISSPISRIAVHHRLLDALHARARECLLLEHERAEPAHATRDDRSGPRVPRHLVACFESCGECVRAARGATARRAGCEPRGRPQSIDAATMSSLRASAAGPTSVAPLPCVRRYRPNRLASRHRYAIGVGERQQQARRIVRLERARGRVAFDAASRRNRRSSKSAVRRTRCNASRSTAVPGGGAASRRTSIRCRRSGSGRLRRCATDRAR